MTTATRYAGLVALLALFTATPSLGQSRTTMPDGYPSHSCRRWIVQMSKRCTARAGEASEEVGDDRFGNGWLLRSARPAEPT